MRFPLVSIVIPCFNARWYVGDAIESALAQTYDPKEVIVVDDGSTDGSVSVIRRYRNITAIQQPHGGAPRARNAGLEAARGEYVQFLDADDFILPDKTSLQMQALQESGGDLAYGDWRHVWCNRKRCRLSELQCAATPGRLLESLLMGETVLLTTSTLMSRRAVLQVGGWRESMTTNDDFDLWCRLLLNGAQAVHVPTYCAIWRKWSLVSVSESNLRAKWRYGAIIRGMVLNHLRRAGRLDQRHSRALAIGYRAVARSCYETDRELWQHCLRRMSQLVSPGARAESAKYRLARAVLGYKGAESLLMTAARFRPGRHLAEYEFTQDVGLPPCRGECRTSVKQ